MPRHTAFIRFELAPGTQAHLRIKIRSDSNGTGFPLSTGLCSIPSQYLLHLIRWLPHIEELWAEYLDAKGDPMSRCRQKAANKRLECLEQWWLGESAQSERMINNEQASPRTETDISDTSSATLDAQISREASGVLDSSALVVASQLLAQKNAIRQGFGDAMGCLFVEGVRLQKRLEVDAAHAVSTSHADGRKGHELILKSSDRCRVSVHSHPTTASRVSELPKAASSEVPSAD